MFIEVILYEYISFFLKRIRYDTKRKRYKRMFFKNKK